MLLVKRPKAPQGFNKGAKDQRDKIRKMVENGERPDSKDFEDRWSKFKSTLAGAQNGRCGYCDHYVLVDEHGTVDHYRPKAEIDALYEDPATQGKQRPHSASVTERKEQLVSKRGYHWLAYAWSNYVFSCSICNEIWKKCFFPVAIHPRCCPPRPKGKDEPLLLNCYGKERPSAHLQFNEDGSVEARKAVPSAQPPASQKLDERGHSRYGAETIRTVGLDRDPLRKARQDITERAFDCLRRYADGNEADAIRDLRRLGSDEEGRSFPGVVRAIVEMEMDMTWDDFLQAA